MVKAQDDGIRDCELCGDEAVLYCLSDCAFLCSKCDARVHEVNFLVARHVRKPVCRNSRQLFAGGFVTGAGFDDGDSFPALCNSCSPESSCSDSDSLSSASSSCISTTISAGKKMRRTTTAYRKMRKTGAKSTRAHAKLGAVLATWCRKIGVADDEMVRIASRIFAVTIGNNAAAGTKRNAATLRLLLAASVWLALRVRKAASLEAVRMLEAVSGVKEKAVVGVAARIAELVRKRRAEEEEGWGESC